MDTWKGSLALLCKLQLQDFQAIASCILRIVPRSLILQISAFAKRHKASFKKWKMKIVNIEKTKNEK